MEALFDTCLSFTLAQEGGFSNDPRDPGGATFKGITLTSLREWLKTPNVPVSVLKALDAPTIAKFYRQRYWAVCQCGVVPAGIDLMLFDHGVNTGTEHPVKMMQGIIDVEDDGVIGPMTLAAVAAWGPADLIGALRDEQEEYYRSLRTFATFGKGWLNRLSRRYTLAVRLAAQTPPPAAGALAA